jgi:hypothetical protein
MRNQSGLADFSKASSSNDSGCTCIFSCDHFDSRKLAILYKISGTALLDYRDKWYLNDSGAGAPCLPDLERVDVEFAQIYGLILS